MLYLLLCCFDEEAWEGLPEGQRDRIITRYRSLERELMESGRHLPGANLGSRAWAATVRLRNGRPAVTDGPFAETKETIGGYHPVECRGLDEARAIALRIRALPAGGRRAPTVDAKTCGSPPGSIGRPPGARSRGGCRPARPPAAGTEASSENRPDARSA